MNLKAQNELIKNYSDARKNYDEYDGDSKMYWKGVMSTYQRVLNDLCPGWGDTKIGRDVFYEQKTFEEANQTLCQQ